MALRAVLFGLEGVLIKEGSTGLPRAVATELGQLFSYLNGKGIRPIILSNRDWKQTNAKTGAIRSIDEVLEKRYPPHSLYVTSRMGLPRKPCKEAVTAILKKHGLSNAEVLYVGTSDIDFKTAVNSRLLFLNAIWDRQDVRYGFIVSSPSEIGRFIDAFGLKSHPWFYQVDSPIRYRSLSPFSTLREDYKEYSEAARQAAKAGTPERHFFLNSLVGSLYFSGMTEEFDYITCYPGHGAGYGNPAMNDVLAVLGDCLRKRFLPDLIVRHHTAPQSRLLRIRKKKPDPLSQLNTIVLNQKPQKHTGEPYKRPLNLDGKGVLVVDDFCTAGYSLEAARLFLEEAGAKTVLLSWLKTINTDYEVIKLKNSFNPYSPQEFNPGDLKFKKLPYHNHIVDNVAPEEIKKTFERYKKWSFTN